MLTRRSFISSLASTFALIGWRPAWAQPAQTANVTFVLFNDFYLTGEQPFPDGKHRGGFARLAAMVPAGPAHAAAAGRPGVVAPGGGPLSPPVVSGPVPRAHLAAVAHTPGPGDLG